MQIRSHVCSVGQRVPIVRDLGVRLEALGVLSDLVVTHPFEVSYYEVVKQANIVLCVTAGDCFGLYALINVQAVAGVAMLGKFLGNLTKEGGVGPGVDVGAKAGASWI